MNVWGVGLIVCFCIQLCYLHFWCVCGAYIFRCLVFCILVVDVAHVESGCILNLLYSHMEFNFVGEH
jgi:hypothetical protein